MGKQMRRCVVFGAAPFSDARYLKQYLRADDYIIAADGGQRLLAEMGRKPDLLVGDFDSSSPLTDDVPIRVLPVHKDDTDVVAALRCALEEGYRDFLLLGCLGGRIDHTLANVMLLCFLQRYNATGVLVDEQQEIRFLTPGTYTLKPQKGRMLSLLPYGGAVRGITLRNLAYPLENAVFDMDYPYGVSNEFTEKPAEISFSEGLLLMIYAKDR